MSKSYFYLMRLGLLFLLLFLYACTKDEFLNSRDAQLRVSTDTLHFDTVFVTAGSTYRSFQVVNDYDQHLRITSLHIGGGSSSPFKLNLNGRSGIRFENLVVEKKDSLYGWIQVNIDPNTSNGAFILRDSIVIELNGRIQKIQLEAWGSNAHFLRNPRITQTQTWTNDKPYVILGGLTIDPTATLTLSPGTQLYLHADAAILVKGTIQALGGADPTERIHLQGDRLDEPYRHYPAAWPGIYIQPGSTNNIFRYTTIRQAYQGLVAEQGASNINPVLKLEQCEIDNAYDAGLIGLNTSIVAENCLISNCGQNAVLVGGGNYRFTHCTLVSYANRYLDHQKPVLTLTNFTNNTVAPLTAGFTNCIFWGEGGTVEEEVLLSKQTTAPFQADFRNVLWKMPSNPALATVSQAIANQSPLFDSIQPTNRFYNFRLRNVSPALNAGIATGLTVDLDGRSRAVGLPDLGCYEKQ